MSLLLVSKHWKKTQATDSNLWPGHVLSSYTTRLHETRGCLHAGTLTPVPWMLKNFYHLIIRHKTIYNSNFTGMISEKLTDARKHIYLTAVVCHHKAQPATERMQHLGKPDAVGGNAYYIFNISQRRSRITSKISLIVLLLVKLNPFQRPHEYSFILFWIMV